MAERQLQPILAAGTKKEFVMSYLSSIGRPANDATTHYPNGKCATARSGTFKWNCEYPSYVSTGWNAGFLSIIEPHVGVYFVFNEKNELVKYYLNVSYSFL